MGLCGAQGARGSWGTYCVPMSSMRVEVREMLDAGEQRPEAAGHKLLEVLRQRRVGNSEAKNAV